MAIPLRLPRLAAGLALAAILVLQPPGTPSAAVDVSTECQATTITAFAEADAWVSESNSSTTGSDSTLNVEANPAHGNSRALVRFAMPNAVPEGCVVESARLRLYTLLGSDGDRLEAVRLAAAWSEGSVTWSSQPATTGPTALAWSSDGYLRWTVTSQVQAMYETGANHGFLVSDAAEGTDGGAMHGFNSKEKGESPPQLVIRFAAPPSGEPPPPAPPVPAAVRCGQILTQSTLVTNNLSGCLGDGLVIGAPRIIVDLDGHTIDGTGLGIGVHNDGYTDVTVRNGTVADFDYGVRLMPESSENVVERLMLRLNQVAAIEVFDAPDNQIRDNALDQNGSGVELVNGTTGTVVAGNTITTNGGAGFMLRDSDANWLEDNTMVGGGDLGFELEGSNWNTVIGNTVTGNSDGGIELGEASNDNRIESNTLMESGDSGILVSDSDRSHLIGNTVHRVSDNGIGLDGANDSVVRGNDVRFNSGGFGVDGSRNLIEANNASETTGIGIELGTGAFENHVVGNTANANSQTGISLEGEADPGLGNLIEGNTASANRVDGIFAAMGGHTITANVARDNAGWGISALGSIDGGGNLASGNGQRAQCSGVVCRATADTTPPETTVGSGPAVTTSSTSATFTFSASEPGSTFQCSLDAAAFTGCTSPRQYTGLAAGAHQFQVRAIDPAGNVDATPASHSWTVEPAADTTPPETTIGSGPAATTSSTSATFTFSASEPGSTFQCSLDAAAFTGCTSPRQYTGLAAGTHQFQVRAIDPAGNVDATPAGHSWTVEVGSSCGASTTTLAATADAWVEQNSPTNNKGTDSVLKVSSKGPTDNSRALVRFALPASVPQSCVIASATLRLYSDSARTGRTLQVHRLAGSWTENGVTWTNQPVTAGTAATTTSGNGYREWNVVSHVQATYDTGTSHGFLIRDASENQDAEQSFHSREKGENLPQLVIRFGPA
ncbi:MAG TPA: DNRLRE domain-containing protein [Nocardioidaceae bacterium]|nr:DNRLRE domain-containing protein [Nocardioidaceae bacterium]